MKRWRLVQKMVSQFWLSWSQDYLTNLQRTNKWRHPSRNLQLGDLVLMKDDSSPLSARWPVGRIIEVHPGKDDLVRAATLKTVSTQSNGDIKAHTFKRPIAKLCYLPHIVNTPQDQPTAEPLQQAHIYHSTASRLLRNMLLPLLILSLFGNSLCQQAPYPSLTAINTSGIFFAYKGTILLHRGTWHWTINLGSNQTQDLQAIKSTMETLENFCKNISQTHDISCDQKLKNIRDNYMEAVNSIQNQPLKRSKRSGGILGWITDLIFGHNYGIELDRLAERQVGADRRTSGLLVSTFSSLNSIDKNNHNYMNQLQANINKVALHNQRYTNQSNAMEDLNQYLDETNHALRIMEKRYEHIKDRSIISKADWKGALSAMSSTLANDTRVPFDPEDITQLQLCDWTTKVINQTLHVIIEIPIVDSGLRFDELTAFPLPTNLTVLDSPPTTICVNDDEQMYFYSYVTLFQLKEDAKVIDVPIIRNAKTDADCISSAIFRHQTNMTECPIKLLPLTGYDNWYQLPHHNSFLFCTTFAENITITCKSLTYHTAAQKGVLTLQPGCQLKSYTRIIQASNDVTTSMKKFFLYQTNFTLPNHTIPKINTSLIIDDEDKTMFTKLTELAKDLLSAIAFIPFTILIIGAALYYYYIYRRRGQPSPQNPDPPTSGTWDAVSDFLPSKAT